MAIDQHVEYARVAVALSRLKLAGDQLQSARSEISVTASAQRPAVLAIEAALLPIARAMHDCEALLRQIARAT